MFIENFSQMFTDLFADNRRKNQRKSACFQSAIISERFSYNFYFSQIHGDFFRRFTQKKISENQRVFNQRLSARD